MCSSIEMHYYCASTDLYLWRGGGDRRGIDAVTVQAVPLNETAGGYNQRQPYYTAGDVLLSLEQLLRSLNNLESRLYHVSRCKKSFGIDVVCI